MLSSASVACADPIAANYAHLIGGAGQNLETATCVYFDGITDWPLDRLPGFVDQIFANEACKPRIVLAEKNAEEKSPSRTMKWLRATIDDGPDSFRETFDSLQFFPKGRSTIEDTWWPSVYFAVSFRPGSPSAFFCVNKRLDESGIRQQLDAIGAILGSCAAYGFCFPTVFSPLGYFWGIAVNPGYRREGAYADKEKRRLSHWRDNSKIGIFGGSGERRFFYACDGYVRDAYPLMFLSEKHMSRRVGGSTLMERLRKGDLGEIEAVGDKHLWRIPAEKLAAAQKLLDDNDISLSGRRLEGVKG